VGLVTDYDVWKEGEEVSTEKVVATIHQNVANVKKLLQSAIPALDRQRQCECTHAAQYALMTNPKFISKQNLKKLDLIIGKYVKGSKQ
jgi:5'-methylthioadenosine phosphorylase